jgi:hypothetical protein
MSITQRMYPPVVEPVLPRRAHRPMGTQR